MNATLRILIVDDDHYMARTLADIFKFKGYKAEIAHSGAEALDKMARNSFDFVLSDVRMPDVDGIEMYRAIKIRRPDLPVVLMTAYSTDTLVKEALANGALAVLTKPLDIDRVLTFLAR
jgi:DNA-binding NtrC family response regulator